MTLDPFNRNDWILARQIGVEGAVFHLQTPAAEHPELLTEKGLGMVQKDLSSVGLELSVVEGDPFPLNSVKLGGEDRNGILEKYVGFLNVLGALGIRTVCYNFMAGVNWFRTSSSYRLRGGALASGFNMDDVKGKVVDLDGVDLTYDMLVDNHRRFLDTVLPVAERNGIHMALHPDDPPINPFLNVPRLAASFDSYQELLDEFDSASLGVAFCQSNFKLMNGNLEEMIRYFGERGKLFFIHFRDVEGTVENFHETFHDDGPTDMARMMYLYMKYCDEDTPIRPDHVPSLIGEDTKNVGYTMKGRLFAIGYMRGLMHGLRNREK